MVDREAFLDIMKAFPTGVTIITTLDLGGEPRGLTTNAVTSVSATDRVLLACIDRESRTLPALQERAAFVVNFMNSASEAVCRLFASKHEDKFRRVPWSLTTGGLPRLRRHAIAWAECEIVKEVDAGDHVILFGQVVREGCDDGEHEPAVYWRRQFHRCSPL